ncbi:MAG TPA: hypothetical protein VGJ00_02445 [Rhabdochlamydiaceae bacterium]|jgi:NADH:ubiquinone oxidoreductase subunit 2 (subunit N)
MTQDKTNTWNEYKLLPRLKFLGYVFFLLSLASLLFAFFAHSEKNTATPTFTFDENSKLADIEALAGAVLFSNMQPLELQPQDVFNFYIVSIIFGSIGSGIFYYSSKKLKLVTREEE